MNSSGAASNLIESGEVTFTLTVADFRSGMLAYRHKSALRRWSFRLLTGVIVLIVGLILILFITARDSNASRNLAPLGVLCILWVGLIWVSPSLSARHQFRHHPSAKGPVTLNFSEKGVHFSSQFYDSRIQWSAYSNWVEEPLVIALFTGPKVFYPIPKRAFDKQQLNQFRDLLKRLVKIT